MRLRRGRQIGVGEEIAQFSDGIAPLGLHAHKRQADLREDRVDEGVSVPAFGQKMAAVIDLDRGDRIESEDVADHKVDALGHNGVEGPAAKVHSPVRRVRELGQPHLRERAIAGAERRIERPQKNLLVGAQEPAAPIADPAPDREAAEREDEDRDDPDDIEQGGGTIEESAKPRPTVLSKRLREDGQRSRHLVSRST